MSRLPLAGIALMISVGAALAAPLPDDALLSAFAVACLDGYGDPEQRARAIAAAGWHTVRDDADPVLARMLAIARAGLRDAQEQDGYTGGAMVYGKGDGHEGPYLVTTELHMPDDGSGSFDIMGCYLYDFEAVTPLDPAPIIARFDEEPSEVEDQPGIIVSQSWAIESLENVWELRSTFIPAGSPGVDVTGFAGRTLLITTTRG